MTITRMINKYMTLSKMTLNKMTLSIMSCTITTLTIMTIWKRHSAIEIQQKILSTMPLSILIAITLWKMILGKMMLSKMILSKMALSITTLNKMELTIMTISMMILSTTKSALRHEAQQHSTLQLSAWQHSLKLTTLCHTALRQLSSKLKGSSLLKSVYALSFAFKPNILSVINVKVVMLNVVAPSYQVKECLGVNIGTLGWFHKTFFCLNLTSSFCKLDHSINVAVIFLCRESV